MNIFSNMPAYCWGHTVGAKSSIAISNVTFKIAIPDGRIGNIRNPIVARLCEPTEFEVEGWKKIISVEKCLNQFIPGAWANLQLNTRKIECNVLTGEGILPNPNFHH